MKFFSRINPTARGFAIIILIAVVIYVLQLQTTLSVVSALLGIAFILALTFFVYLVWRDNRSEISTWSLRARLSFYGAALLIVADLGARWWYGAGGYDLLAFLAVLVICGFAMWRVWRDQHTYA